MTTIVGRRQELLLDRAGGDRDVELLMGLLTTARRVIRAYNAGLAEHDVTDGRFAALLAIDAEPGITPAALADRLVVTRATVTGLVDNLVKRDLVIREADETDRRTLALHLTEDGRATVATVAPLVTGWFTAVADGIEPADRDAAWRTFAQIQANVRDRSPGTDV
ncbi:MarR family transcriptional regulator [Gordonia sp. PP30]|uniref:MarR family winged helix-turn-helix transcriptional regulator n=1 Tax=Gordonia sp. PP30 TaxID=2935861 RepID=UPI001FFFE595|nr:MarR family transcriptional regulator [Gordonia sp. PP30]UQE73262.1 MarR family transcriptional regulator [Gordonia sp. PP30]